MTENKHWISITGVKMLKKCFFTILLLTISLHSNLFAQDALKKGSYSLAGSISFTNSTNESAYGETKDLSLYMHPSITYFFVENLSAGLSFAYGYSEFTIQNDKYISRPISFGPVIRYYFPSEKFIPFIEASYNYSNSLSGNEDMNSFSFAGGINYFLSRSVALEPFLEYQKSNYIIGDQKTSSVAIGMRINYFIVD